MERYLSNDELIKHLEKKGMLFRDKKKASIVLDNIGYYKLKEFSYIYKEGNNFKKEVYFEMLVNSFYLDKKLRFELLSLIEYIELYLKSNLVTIMSKYDYYDIDSYSININKMKKNNLLSKFRNKNKMIREEISYKKVLKKFSKREGILPIWAIMEVISLGEITEILEIFKPTLLEKMYKIFDSNYIDFLERIEFIKNIRNRAAHNNDIITENFIYRNKEINICDVIDLVKETVNKLEIKVDINKIEEIKREIIGG